MCAYCRTFVHQLLHICAPIDAQKCISREEGVSKCIVYVILSEVVILSLSKELKPKKSKLLIIKVPSTPLRSAQDDKSEDYCILTHLLHGYGNGFP